MSYRRLQTLLRKKYREGIWCAVNTLREKLTVPVISAYQAEPVLPFTYPVFSILFNIKSKLIPYADSKRFTRLPLPAKSR